MGTILAAKNKILLNKLNVKCILTCASEAEVNFENFYHKKIEIFDLETENI